MPASDPKHMHRSPWGWIVLSICLILLSVELLFDPISTIVNLAHATRIRVELQAAQARWVDREISDYQIAISGYTPLVCMVMEETIAVRGGTPPPKGQAFSEQMCTVPRSVPEAFQKVEKNLKGSFKGRLRVAFDAEYGYVSSYSFDCNACNGLLCPRITDCSEWFRLSDLKPLANP